MLSASSDDFRRCCPNNVRIRHGVSNAANSGQSEVIVIKSELAWTELPGKLCRSVHNIDVNLTAVQTSHEVRPAS